MPQALFVLGPPTSGKTTLIRERLPNAVHVAIDWIHNPTSLQLAAVIQAAYRKFRLAIAARQDVAVEACSERLFWEKVREARNAGYEVEVVRTTTRYGPAQSAKQGWYPNGGRPKHRPYDKPLYRKRRKALRATITPATRCAAPGCGKLLSEHRPHRSGKPARWEVGHGIPGRNDGPLALWASTCNLREGAQRGGRNERNRVSPNA